MRSLWNADARICPKCACFPCSVSLNILPQFWSTPMLAIQFSWSWPHSQTVSLDLLSVAPQINRHTFAEVAASSFNLAEFFFKCNFRLLVVEWALSPVCMVGSRRLMLINCTVLISLVCISDNAWPERGLHYIIITLRGLMLQCMFTHACNFFKCVFGLNMPIKRDWP